MKMTWEQFEETGAVRDYLAYRESAGRVRTWMEQRGAESIEAKKETEHGTDNHSDRPDTGSVSIQ